MNPITKRLSILIITVLSISMLWSTISAADAVDVTNEQPNRMTARPVVLTTDEQIERARERVAHQTQPFYKSWELTLSAAERALLKTYVPEQSEDHTTYFDLGRIHAQDVRSLALAYHITGDARYLAKARLILTDWADNALNSPHPSRGSPHSAGLVIGRVMSIFTDAYAMLWRELDDQDRQLIEAWFRRSLEPLRESRQIWETAELICTYGECTEHEAPWLDRQYFNNHLGAQNLGIVAIGFALRDEAVIREGMNSPDNPRNLQALLTGAILIDNADAYEQDWTLTQGAPDVQPGEIFDRYRNNSGRGLHYSHIHLRFLTLQAEIARNNGYPIDWYAFTGGKGQNLELSFTFYADFLLSGNPGARGGYYSNSAIDYGLLPLYEIAHNRYPDNEKIRQVLEGGRLEFDVETFGYSLPLTHGADGLGPASLASLQFLVEKYADANELKRPLLNMLTNWLDIAERFASKGNKDQAVRSIEDFLEHLNRASMQPHVSAAAKGALTHEAQQLLELWACVDCGSNTRQPSWAFNQDGNLEGWRMRKSVVGEVSGGTLNLSITGSDPGILSPNFLDIDAGKYKNVIIRMRNHTSDTSANLFFITDSDSAYNGEKVEFYTIEPNSDGFVDYVVPMGNNPYWQGRIEQIRIDVVHRATTGTVEIDSIRFSE